MTEAVQKTPAEPTVFEKLLGLIERTPKALDILQKADNPGRGRELLETHAAQFDAVTDKMAAAFSFAKDVNGGARKDLPGSLQSAFTQAALNIRRELPEQEKLPYLLQKLAVEISQTKVQDATEAGQAENLSASAILRRDALVEAVVKDKTVEIVQHPPPVKNKAPTRKP